MPRSRTCPSAGTWLISAVVSEIIWLLNIFNYPVNLDAWNIIAQHGFRVEIILACTGMQSIAIMLGVAAAVPTTLRQKAYAFLLVAPTIYILNLFRNVFVIMAYTGQWFPYFPDIAGNGEIGYESFFWAHNVIAELLALVVLIVIAYGLFTLIPQLGSFADELYQLYYGEVVRELGRIRGKGTGTPAPLPNRCPGLSRRLQKYRMSRENSSNRAVFPGGTIMFFCFLRIFILPETESG